VPQDNKPGGQVRERGQGALVMAGLYITLLEKTLQS
jgi:hypothetical protein